MRRNSEGEFTLTVDNRTEVIDARKEIFMTPVGLDYKRSYYTPENADADLEKILKAAQLVAGGPNITVRNMEYALRLILDAGEIQPKDFAPSTPLEEVEPDTRPRTSDGKIMTPAQAAWSEYRQFAESASMAEVNRRKQVDAGFANFVRKNLEREMAVPIGDAVTPAGEPTKNSRSNAELVDFANKYNAEPVANLKPKGGFVTLAGIQTPYSQFIEMVNRCAAARLL